MTFQSTHSLRSATIRNWPGGLISQVSIHALLAECDYQGPLARAQRQRFQSTHSLRSATPCGTFTFSGNRVSIHALLAECDLARVKRYPAGCRFNPRTPCGVRLYATGRVASYRKFQSTHSLRSATAGFDRIIALVAVSIHALLAECDLWLEFAFSVMSGFNPRTPCGVRRNRLYTLLLNRANHTLRQPP